MAEMNTEMVDFILTLLQQGGVITSVQYSSIMGKVRAIPYGTTLSSATQRIAEGG